MKKLKSVKNPVAYMDTLDYMRFVENVPTEIRYKTRVHIRETIEAKFENMMANLVALND